MHTNTEDNYRYRNLSLTVLEKALDDICPKFESEPENVRASLIKSRISAFKAFEKEIDQEWKALEKEAKDALQNYEREKKEHLKHLKSANKATKITHKLAVFVRNRDYKVSYFKNKKSSAINDLREKIKALPKDSPKVIQLKEKIDKVTKESDRKIKATIDRYEAIISKFKQLEAEEIHKNTYLKHEKLWASKYRRLKKYFNAKEKVHHNKRTEYDQIRLSLEGFIERQDRIEHWCLLAGVSMRSCYLEVNERLKLIGRSSPEVVEILRSL